MVQDAADASGGGDSGHPRGVRNAARGSARMNGAEFKERGWRLRVPDYVVMSDRAGKGVGRISRTWRRR